MVQSLDHLVQGLDHLPQVTKRRQSKRDLHFDFWFNLAPLVDILVQKVFKKMYQNEVQERVLNEAKFRIQGKSGECEFDTLLIMFSPR